MLSLISNKSTILAKLKILLILNHKYNIVVVKLLLHQPAFRYRPYNWNLAMHKPMVRSIEIRANPADGIQ